jgi:hypothetical protein
MTDRINSLTIVLDKDYRDDDCENIIKAIQMIKGVLSVKGNVSNYSDHIAHERIKNEYREKYWELFK